MFDTLVVYDVFRGDPLPPLGPETAYGYVLAGNGLFLRAEHRFWRALLLVEPFGVRGLPMLQPAFDLRIPRLPADFLRQAVTDARRSVDGEGRHIEVLYRFTYDGAAHRLVKPSQQGTPGRVEAEEPPGAEVVLELHSHGSLRAFFSATDDRDEQDLRLYGVVGQVEAPLPELRFRLACYGYWMQLTYEHLFTLPAPFTDGQTVSCDVELAREGPLAALWRRLKGGSSHGRP